MSKNLINWAIFIALCLIWGSSFVLMKLGLYDSNGQSLLSPYQVAAIRILSAGLILIPFLLANWKKIPFNLSGYIILSGLIGSFIPAFLFCIAETKIDSALAGTLNALTPIFVILAGLIIYGNKVPSNKVWGIILGFTGSLLLFFSKRNENLGEVGYIGFAVLATILYGINVNMVKQKLGSVSSTIIVAYAFAVLAIPSAFILWYTGFFELPLQTTIYLKAIGAAGTLGIFGTALASVLFYVLMRRGGLIFATLVTYGIPFVALGWGWYYGEKIGMIQIICLLVILSGVYLANLDFAKIKSDAKRMMGR